MSRTKAIDFEVIFRKCLPPGSPWVPKEYELGSEPGGNLITNGDFTDESGAPWIAGWTVYNSAAGGEQASVNVFPGSGKATFAYVAV